jgi:hypothetical protein
VSALWGSHTPRVPQWCACGAKSLTGPVCATCTREREAKALRDADAAAYRRRGSNRPKRGAP